MLKLGAAGIGGGGGRVGRLPLKLERQCRERHIMLIDLKWLWNK